MGARVLRMKRAEPNPSRTMTRQRDRGQASNPPGPARPEILPFHAHTPNPQDKRTSPGDITLILSKPKDSRTGIAATLFQLAYPELLRMAEGKCRRERPGHTLQPEDLLNETFLRFCAQLPSTKNAVKRAYFFGAASRSMDQVLVNHARRRDAKKRGGLYPHVQLEETNVIASPVPDTLALHQVLDRLRGLDFRLYRITVLRLQGLSHSQMAAFCHRAESTIRRDWSIAKAWLRREMGGVP